MIRIAFLIRSLEIGGAERQLVTLIKELDRTQFDVSVICFYPGDFLQDELIEAGIPVLVMEKSGRWDLLKFFLRLLKTVRRLEPQILHGYLEVPNMLALMLKPFLPHTRVVMGVRSSVLNVRNYGRLYQMVTLIEERLAPFADLVIANSKAGQRTCISRGFPAERIIVIPNGIHTGYFEPDRSQGEELRRKWGIPPQAVLVGLVGRMDLIKGYPVFLEAAARALKNQPELYFASIGGGNMQLIEEYRTQAHALNLGARMFWAGEQTQMKAVYNALDICCNASYGEGLSNALAEAMSCAVPCVATDVGDSAILLGDTGLVVPSNNPAAMALAFEQLAVGGAALRQAMGRRARQRILDYFSVDQMSKSTAAALHKLVERGRFAA